MNVYVDVAIVIFSAFLIISLMVTAVTELFASFLKVRAGSLKKALASVLDDDSIRKGFYDNVLLLGATFEGQPSGKDQTPSKWQHPSYVAPEAFARALLKSVAEKGGNADDTPLAEVPLSELRETVKKIEAPQIRALLLGLITDTSKSLTDLETDVSTWFDRMMSRLSGKYKRTQQIVSFFVGLGLAATFNLDVVGLASDVYQDDQLRAELVASAEAYVALQEVTEAQSDAEADQIGKVRDLSGRMDDFALGWPGSPGWGVLGHVPGWILAALAATLGAPFWFDMLSRFVRVRGTGTKPAPSHPSSAA